MNDYNNQFILGHDLGTTSVILPSPLTIPSDNYSGTDNAGTLGVTGLSACFDTSLL